MKQSAHALCYVGHGIYELQCVEPRPRHQTVLHEHNGHHRQFSVAANVQLGAQHAWPQRDPPCQQHQGLLQHRPGHLQNCLLHLNILSLLVFGHVPASQRGGGKGQCGKGGAARMTAVSATSSSQTDSPRALNDPTQGFSHPAREST